MTQSSWRRLMPGIGSHHTDEMDPRTLYSLAAMLILVQLPHLLNLPVWVSIIGLLLVGARLALLKKPSHAVLTVVISPTCVTLIAALSAIVIKWDFGYFIGRDPCVAFLFVLVAAKFAEVRRANDATLLLCLSAFLLLTQYFYSQTIISALITLPAVFALAYSLSALRDSSNPESTSQQLKLIGSLLLQGAPLAAMLFFVFPRLPGPLWSLPEDAMATTGLSDSMSPGSIGKLSQSDAVAFRVDFDALVPDAQALYWRGPVLTDFDGRNWGLSRLRFETKRQYSGPEADLVHYTVTLEPHRKRWLFALDQAASLPRSYSAAGADDPQYARALGQLHDDGQILARDPVTQTLRYRVSSVMSHGVPSINRPHNQTLYLPGQNVRTIDFARSLRARFASDAHYADGVLKYFNEKHFRYTLEPQILGNLPVDEFMFDTLEGFCEHYASAFVVMMRAAGVPSRVVTGYQGGEMNEDYMIVRQSDAHAWAEAYIDGVWQRYDPTSAVAPSRIERGLSAALPDDASVPRMARQAPGLFRDMQLRWDAINHQWHRLVIDFDNDYQASMWERAGLGKPALWQLSVLVIVLAALWSALVLGLPRFGSGGLARQELYWLRLTRFLGARSLTRRSSESAQAYLKRAAAQWPSQQARLQRLDTTFSRARFQITDPEEQQRLLAELRRDLFWLRWQLRVREIINYPFRLFLRPSSKV